MENATIAMHIYTSESAEENEEDWIEELERKR
jgi:hypothetical protein